MLKSAWATMRSANSFMIRLFLLASFVVMIAEPVTGQKSYDAGASDTEIKIGNIAPYTGLGNEYAAVARAEAAYFSMINDGGGINGRKITFISVDNASDAGSPWISRESWSRRTRSC